MYRIILIMYSSHGNNNALLSLVRKLFIRYITVLLHTHILLVHHKPTHYLSRYKQALLFYYQFLVIHHWFIFLNYLNIFLYTFTILFLYFYDSIHMLAYNFKTYTWISSNIMYIQLVNIAPLLCHSLAFRVKKELLVNGVK